MSCRDVLQDTNGLASGSPTAEALRVATPLAPTAASSEALGIFGKYLSVWIALCMVVGTLIGALAPSVSNTLAKATVAEISLPVAILVWFSESSVRGPRVLSYFVFLQ
jgi:hypothetical protein